MKGEKEINEKRKWQTDNVHHPGEILICSQGWPSLHYTLTSKKRRKKRLFTLCNHTGIWCACGCVNVCVCAHLSACVHELFVSPPQALSCWVCSLKRLCFCCHPSLSCSLCFLACIRTPLFCLRVRIIHHRRPVCLYSIIDVLS